jgi:hypothetical protein
MERGGKRVTRRVAIWLSLIVVFLLLGELVTRAYYFYLHDYAPFYLISPFGSGSKKRLPEDPYRVGKTLYGTDPCFNRKIAFTVNGQGGRGKEWALAKQPGTFRIITLGASSTFGSDSPDWATWPAFLEDALRRRYGANIEVLNASWPGVRIGYLLHWFTKELYRYNPDMVIYYEGWNDTPLEPSSEVEANVLHMHSFTRLGPLVSWLHYRSMLYTYLVEKIQFHLAKRYTAGIIPRVGYFQREIKRFVELTRKHRAIPVLVLQANSSELEPEIRDLRLEDQQAIRAVILNAADANSRSDFDRPAKIRLYQAQILVEVVRRAGGALGVQVIDPRLALVHSKEAAPVFCGPIHLTDLGNQILANYIAEQLRLSGGAGQPVASRERIFDSLESSAAR